MTQYGIRYGIFGSLALVLLFFFYNEINPNLFFNPPARIGIMLLYGAFMVMAGQAARKANGQFIDFKEVLKPIFLVAVIMLGVSTIYYYLLYNFINPSLPQIQHEHMIMFYDWAYNVDTAETRDALKTLKEVPPSDYIPTIGSSIKSYLTFLALTAIPAFILALILKRKPIHFDN